VAQPLDVTIIYERDPDSDWIVATIPEVLGVHSQGKTRQEARELVLDALAGMAKLRAIGAYGLPNRDGASGTREPRPTVR